MSAPGVRPWFEKRSRRRVLDFCTVAGDETKYMAKQVFDDGWLFAFGRLGGQVQEEKSYREVPRV